MRILTCRPGQTVQIDLPPQHHGGLPARHLFVQGPIEIYIGRIREQEVRIAVKCHPRLTVKQLAEGHK